MAAERRYVIVGGAGGRRARLEVDGERLRWAWDGDAAPAVDVGLGEPFELIVREENRGGIVTGTGLFLVALAGLWWANASVGPVAIGLAAVAGVGLVALGLRARRTIVELRAGAFGERLVCAGAGRQRARAAADYVRVRSGKARREPSKTVMAFIVREAGALVASRVELANEYLAITEGKGDPAHEARFVQLRRRMALFNLAWIVLVPVAVAVAAWFVWPTEDGIWRGLRSILAFLALSLVGLKSLPALQRSFARWF